MPTDFWNSRTISSVRFMELMGKGCSSHKARIWLWNAVEKISCLWAARRTRGCSWARRDFGGYPGEIRTLGHPSKILCHNLVATIHEVCELGIEPCFGQVKQRRPRIQRTPGGYLDSWAPPKCLVRIFGPFPCGGVVTIHSQTKEITRSGQFWAFAHFSRNVRRGARRFESACQLGGRRASRL